MWREDYDTDMSENFLGVNKSYFYWLVGCLVYSRCSHLEHRASVKRFVSLQFPNLRHSVRLLGRVISSSQGHYLTRKQNKHKQTSMPRVGFEPTIPGLERAKTVRALDRAVTVIDIIVLITIKPEGLF
jgi:flagellar biosynthesis/type III secretory pathway ATPase